MLLALVACGASSRTKALQVNLHALDTASGAMLSISKERETQIVEHATTKEEGRAALDAWRARVDAVEQAIEMGYRAVYSASILNDATSASEAGAAVVKALALLKEIKKP